MTKDYLVEIKVKNNLLYKKIKDAGYANMADFAKKNSLCYQTLIKYLNFSRAPIDEKTGQSLAIKLPSQVSLASINKSSCRRQIKSELSLFDNMSNRREWPVALHSLFEQATCIRQWVW